MDDKDKQILKILKSNGRAGYSAIGGKVGLSEGAVRKRIKTLADAGVIRKFTVKSALQKAQKPSPCWLRTRLTQPKKSPRKYVKFQT